MRRRKPSLLADSLDLLLDTICNTFGAVIFIATLVAILIGRSVYSPVVSDEISVSEEIIQNQRQRINAAESRLQQLDTQHQIQQKIIDQLASHQSKEIAMQVVAATQKLTSLSSQHVAIVDSVSSTQALNLEIEEKLHKQSLEIAKLTEQNKRLKSKLAETSELASRTANIPQVRSTTKQGVVFMLHKTRLYRAITPEGIIDDVDCILSENQGVNIIKPRPGSGTLIPSDDAPDVRKKLDGLRKSDHYVRLFVSRDSFAQFQPLKNLMIRLGYEYEIILFTDNKAELYLSPSQVKSYVQ